MTVDVARALEPLRAIAPQLSRYAAVSALALGLDFSVFLTPNSAIGHPTLSGVLGYAGGMVLHYQLSRIFVFATAASAKSAHRRFVEFVVSGLIGLAVTAAVIGVATGIGATPILAKVMAAGASFLGVYVIRRSIVFA
jgi:putative flippase GtrA